MTEDDLIWLKMLATIGIAHLSWLGYPYCRLTMMVVMAKRNETLGEAKGYLSKDIFQFNYTDKDAIDEEIRVLANEAREGDQFAQAAFMHYRMSFS